MKGINIAILTTFVLAILYATTSVASIPVKAGIEKSSVTLFSRRGINNYEIDSNDFSSEAFIRSRKRNGSANEDEVTTADASSIVKILNKRQASSEVDSNSSVGKR
ncbi:1084_t:CDS:2 [Funneliformis caledonium]|uniref:1084_t:CDS:1 n=1 Tax=Funneliformis caledonium TaxID=1117310 RepID=A0A9N9EDC4_9GLOM|nr:1084_t:CDS:2 [Funneliformis caledonium]